MSMRRIFPRFASLHNHGAVGLCRMLARKPRMSGIRTVMPESTSHSEIAADPFCWPMRASPLWCSLLLICFMSNKKVRRPAPASEVWRGVVPRVSFAKTIIFLHSRMGATAKSVQKFISPPPMAETPPPRRHRRRSPAYDLHSAQQDDVLAHNVQRVLVQISSHCRQPMQSLLVGLSSSGVLHFCHSPPDNEYPLPRSLTQSPQLMHLS